MLQQCLNPTSEMNRSKCGSVVLLRICDWLREHTENSQSTLTDVETWMQSTAEEYIEAFKVQRSLAIGPTLVILCPSKLPEFLDSQVILKLENQLKSSLADVSGITVWTASEFHSLYAVPDLEISDPLREDIAHIPFCDSYYVFLTTLIVRYFHRRLSPPKKVVVLDCDNTLWRGIVGEVGPEGIQLDPVHLRLQRRLLELADHGTLLCLCSKNEEQDVSLSLTHGQIFFCPEIRL